MENEEKRMIVVALVSFALLLVAILILTGAEKGVLSKQRFLASILTALLAAVVAVGGIQLVKEKENRASPHEKPPTGSLNPENERR